jgi:hypothetical protein
MYELTDVNVMIRHQKGQIKRLQLYVSIKSSKEFTKKSIWRLNLSKLGSRLNRIRLTTCINLTDFISQSRCNVTQTCFSGGEKIKNDAGKQLDKACNSKMTVELATLRLTNMISCAVHSLVDTT